MACCLSWLQLLSVVVFKNWSVRCSRNLVLILNSSCVANILCMAVRLVACDEVFFGRCISYNSVSSYVNELKVHFDQSSYSAVGKSTCLVRVQRRIMKAQSNQSRTASDTHVHMYIYCVYACVCVCMWPVGGECYLRLPCPLTCESHEL